MTIQELGNIGEFAAAVATLVTLVYLSIQIRQNTRAVRSTAHQGLMDAVHSMGLVLCNSPELARLLVKVHTEEGALTLDERVRFEAYAHRVFGTWENSFFQREQGLVTEDMWEAMVAGYLRYVTTGPFISFWEAERETYLPGFRRFVDATLSGS